MSHNDIVVPTNWDAFVGQAKLKRRLIVSIDAAMNDLRAMGHILLLGQPGTGKSSLARLISQEMGANYTALMMPVKTKHLKKTILETDGVLFLDEIHRLKAKEQEELLLVLEEGYVQLEKERVKIEQPLTIIGATTEPNKIIKSVRDRFAHTPKIEPYTDDDMVEIIRRMAGKLNITLSDYEAQAFGLASAGVPRQARKIIFTVRDLGIADPEAVLDLCGITEDGLTEDHVAYILALDSFASKQAGIEVLSNQTGIPKEILFDLEKLLVTKKLVSYAPRGRELTVAGWKRAEQLALAQ